MIHTPQTFFLLEMLAEFLDDLPLLVNFFLVFMMCAFGIPSVLALRKSLSFRDNKLIKKNYAAPELEQTILQILAKKKGKFIYPVELMRKLRFKGSLEELKTVLQRLKQENKIEFNEENYSYYQVRIP